MNPNRYTPRYIIIKWQGFMIKKRERDTLKGSKRKIIVTRKTL